MLLVLVLACQGVKNVGFEIGLRNAFAGFVQFAKVELGPRVPLLGGLAEPAGGLGGIERHTVAIGIIEPQVVLGGGVAFGGCQAIPADRLGPVLWHAEPVGVD